MGKGVVELGEEVVGERPLGVRGGAVCFAIGVRVDAYDFDGRVLILGDSECVDAAMHGGGGGEDHWVEDIRGIEECGAGCQ